MRNQRQEFGSLLRREAKEKLEEKKVMVAP